MMKENGKLCQLRKAQSEARRSALDVWPDHENFKHNFWSCKTFSI